MPAVRVGEIADLLAARYEGDRGLEISAVRPLAVAGPHDLSFLSNPRYANQVEESRAGAILVPEDYPRHADRLVRVRQPNLALARVLERWFAAVPQPPAGVSPLASIDPDAVIGKDVRIGAFVSVGAGVVIGDGVILHDGVRVGAGTRIGEGSVLHANVVVYHGCSIGRRCILHSGAVIGADGFGYATSEGIHHRVPQIGGVVLEDDVDVGANTTIDRGSIEDTVIGEGTKIDNLVMIAHGVRIGRGCLIVAQVGLAGSARLGDFVVMGGQSGTAGHLEIAGGTQFAARSVAMKSIREPGIYAGFPARPLREYQRAEAGLRRLSRLIRRVAALERAAGITNSEGKRGNDSDD